MYRYSIELVTFKDCREFVKKLEGKTATLTNKNNEFRVSANSLIGTIASLEWDELFVESQEDIYVLIKDWVK